MGDDEDQLRAMVAGKLDADDLEALETRLDRRPELRRALADIALEGDTATHTLALRAPIDAPIDTEPSSSKMVEGVEVGDTLGRGGMALVRLGHQLKLDRAVAVKTLHESRRSKSDVRRLLREARITGRLEHPNIVPVHDIVTGEDGVPQVVLKLIEGATWSTLMRDADAVREMFGATDLLEWNLGVLMAVSRALSFAHSRKVLHRDVKPANVMVGPFGQVYLLDWGIAYELDRPESEEDAQEITGTPGYMAPEQLVGDNLGTWTDTYLLGAILYQLLCGRPPHARASPQSRIVEQLYGTATPPLEEDVPAELRRLVEAALHPDPAKRMAHPEELRQGLASFLQHRGALRLAERGHQERERAAAAHREGDDAEWERGCLAAELAYRASLEEWVECEEATAGVRELAILRIEHALAGGEPHAAARLMESQPGFPEALRERVAAAVASAIQQEAHLRRIISDADRGFGHRMRGILGAAFGLVWVGFWCSMALSPPATVMTLVGFTAGVLCIGIAAVLTLGRQMLENRINRASMWVASTALAMTIVWCLGASWLGLDMSDILIGQLFVCAIAISGMANLVDPWGAVSSVGFAVAFLVACYEPAWMPHAIIGANAVLLINQLVLNMARARRGFDVPPTARALTKSPAGPGDG